VTLELLPNGQLSTDEELYNAARTLRAEYDLRVKIQEQRLLLEDSWLMLYLLVDRGQDGQPDSRQKHYSSRVSSIVDTGRRVLTRNPIRYHIASQHFQSQSRPEREPYRKLENVLHGVLYDIDRQLLARGEMRSRSQAAFHSLVRGAWAYKLHLTSKARTSTGSPLFYTQLDPRTVLPQPGPMGIDSAIAWSTVTLNGLMQQYPEQFRPVAEQMRRAVQNSRAFGTTEDFAFLHAPILLLEWSSIEEHGVLVDLATLPSQYARVLGLDRPDRQDGRYFWVEQPYRHGFGRSLIQAGFVNGVPVSNSYLGPSQYLGPGGKLPLATGGATTEGVATPRIQLPSGEVYAGTQAAIDPLGGFAGRAIFATIAHMIPDYNNLIAVLKDAVVKEVRGTWTFKSRDGKMVTLNLGDGKINPLQLSEQLERVPMQIQTPDALALAQLVSQEIADGSLDLRFILAAEQDASGYQRARMEQAAMIGIDDYREGPELGYLGC